MAALVREHAAYEGASAMARGTAEDFARSGYGQAAFECLIAEADGEPVGFALFFTNFSSWEGRTGMFLEDLYVRAGSAWAAS